MAQIRLLSTCALRLDALLQQAGRLRRKLRRLDSASPRGIRFVDDLIIQNPRDKLAPKRFEFEKTFRTDMGQADVFEAVGPLCCSAMDGYNVCIFAYGQTGSGKTYSMEGTHPLASWPESMPPR